MCPDFDVIGDASDGEGAIERVEELCPDVVVMDVSMPGLGGIEATRKIVSAKPGVRVVALSMHDPMEMESLMRQAGACVYLPKGGPSDRLFQAIREACGAVG